VNNLFQNIEEIQFRGSIKINRIMHLKRLVYNLVIFSGIIMTSSSLVVVTRMTLEVYSILFFTGIFVLFFINTIILGKSSINKTLINYSLVLTIIILFSILINQDYDIVNFVIISILFESIFFFTIVKPKDFIIIYIKSMVILSLYSLIMIYLTPQLFPSIISLFPIRYNPGGFAVIDYGLSFQYVGLVSRNTGLFREMGIYSIYLNFSLFFMLFSGFESKYKNISILIIILTILSTLSTSGLFTMVLLIGAYLLNLNKHNLKATMKLVVLLIIIAIVLSTLMPISRMYFQDSLNKFLNKGSSYYGRVGSIFANIEAWKVSPIIGLGYTKSIEISEGFYSYSEVLHNTSTTTTFLSMYGIIFTVLISAPIIFYVYSLNLNTFSKILIILGLFLSLNSQRLFLDSLMYFLTYSFILLTIKHQKRLGDVEF